MATPSLPTGQPDTAESSQSGQCVKSIVVSALTDTGQEDSLLVGSTTAPTATITGTTTTTTTPQTPPTPTTTTTTATKATQVDLPRETTFAQTKIIPIRTFDSKLQTDGSIRLCHPGTSTGAAFRFHDNHGKNIVLSNNGLTAERKEGGVLDGGGVVVSRDPMQVNKLYEIRVDREAGCRWPLAVGVMTSLPDTLTWQFGSFWEDSAIFVHQSYVIDRHHYTETKAGKDLKDLPADSRVGVSVDVTRRLHLYVNGQHQGVVPCSDLPDPCYALFELRSTNGLRGNSIRITALPVTSLT